jgi:predicted aspartyl protease
MSTRSIATLAASALFVVVVATALVAQSGGGPWDLPTKFDTGTTHLLIQVDVNGTPLWCDLDTGFSALIAIDRAEAVRAGLKEGPGQPTPDGRPAGNGDGSATARLTVGPVTLDNQPLIVRRISADVLDMDCIIGTGVLRQYVIEFEHTRPQVTLHDRRGYKPPANAVTIPLIFRTNPNVPFVRVELESAAGQRHPLQVVFDTGTSYYALAVVPPASTRIREGVPTARHPTQAESGAGPVTLVAGRPSSVSVGPFTVKAPIVALVLGSLGSVDDGTLGEGFLSQFTVGFDLEGRQTYLTPNATFGRSHEFDASGLGFRRGENGFEVNVVIPDTPAARAGVQPGDRLVAIDGMATDRLTPNALRDRLSRPGIRCDLEVRRGDRTMQVSLMLERRL